MRNAGALRLLALQMTLFGASFMPFESVTAFKCWIVLPCEAVTPTSAGFLPASVKTMSARQSYQCCSPAATISSTIAPIHLNMNFNNNESCELSGQDLASYKLMFFFVY